MCGASGHSPGSNSILRGLCVVWGAVRAVMIPARITCCEVRVLWGAVRDVMAPARNAAKSDFIGSPFGTPRFASSPDPRSGGNVAAPIRGPKRCPPRIRAMKPAVPEPFAPPSATLRPALGPLNYLPRARSAVGGRRAAYIAARVRTRTRAVHESCLMCNLVRVLFLHCGIRIFHTRVVVSGLYVDFHG